MMYAEKNIQKVKKYGKQSYGSEAISILPKKETLNLDVVNKTYPSHYKQCSEKHGPPTVLSPNIRMPMPDRLCGTPEPCRVYL